MHVSNESNNKNSKTLIKMMGVLKIEWKTRKECVDLKLVFTIFY
jgi:hypothetical protein